jgi:hypothetical protein
MSSYQDKLKTLKEDDRELANSYFTKAYKIENMFEVVRKSLPLKDPIGNFDSDVVCIIDFDKVNDKIIKILQKFYEVNKDSVFNSYITPFHKTLNDNINLKLLTNELQIINPKRVLVLGVEGLNTDPIMQQFKGERMSKENYELFVNSLGDKEMMKNPEYQKVKMEFNRMMKFMILGVV